MSVLITENWESVFGHISFLKNFNIQKIRKNICLHVIKGLCVLTNISQCGLKNFISF